MTYSLHSFFRSISFPVILVISVLILVESQFVSLAAWQEIITQTPFLLLVAGIILSLRFQQTRVVYIALLLMLSWANNAQVQHFEHLDFSSSFFFISQLFVLCFVAFDQNKELWSRHGIVRLAGLLLLIFLNYKLNNSANLHQYIHWQFVTISSGSVSDGFQVELLLATITLCVLVYRQLKSTSQTNANFWVLAFGLTLMQFGHFEYLTTLVCYCLFGILIIHGVLTDSYQMAFSDELTGISARRALLQSSISLGKHYTLAMLDVDHFKKFNDTYGHDVGDQVLRLVASKLSQVKGGGKAYRYGGEEFTIVFPGKSVDYATPFLEQVRENIANYNMAIRSDDRPDDGKEGKNQRQKPDAGTQYVNVTISIGVAEREGELKDFDQVMKQADEALYRAKQSGRNCLAE